MGNTCSMCGGSGWLRRDVPVSHPDFGRAYPCKCKQNEIVPDLVKWSGVDNANAHWTLDTFPGDPEALEAIHEALRAKQGLWIFWSSAFGTGKTGLLIAAIRALLDRGVAALYQSVPTMLDQLRDSVRRGNLYESLTLLQDIPVLALDEFHRAYDRADEANFTEGSPSWAAEKLFQLIDARYLHWETHLTLIATNREPDQGNPHPIESRFSDTLRVHVIHVNGSDLRPYARRLEGNDYKDYSR